jgi:hypothetical protein
LWRLGRCKSFECFDNQSGKTTGQWERKVATALYNRKWTLASSTSVFTYKGTASSFFCVEREREKEVRAVSFISSPGSSSSSTLLSYVPSCTNLAMELYSNRRRQQHFPMATQTSGWLENNQKYFSFFFYFKKTFGADTRKVGLISIY